VTAWTWLVQELGPAPPRAVAREGVDACDSRPVSPLQRLTRLPGWSRGVTATRPRSREVVVPFRGRPSVRVAPSRLQALPSCPFPSRVQASGSSATGPPPELAPERTLSWRSDSPSEHDRGALPERLSPSSSSHRLSPALGSASPEVLRPYDALSPGAPLCHDRPWPIAGDEGIHPLARFRPRVFSTPRRFQPQHRDDPGLPRARRSGTATPRSFAALFHAASVPGIHPSELSPPEEPRRLSAAVASLRVRRRPYLRREGPSAVRPVSAALRAPAPPGAPREEDVPDRTWARECGFPAIVETACPPHELPREATSTADRRPSGSPAYGRFARFEALLPSGVRSRDRPRAAPGLSPEGALTADRAGALLGFCPFRAFPTTTPGSADCDERPARRALAEVQAPLRTAELTGFDPEA
jgi:hypothetical protein